MAVSLGSATSLPPQRAQQLAQVGIPLAERVLLPHILDITKGLYAGLSWGGDARQVRCCLGLAMLASLPAGFTIAGHCTPWQACMRLLRSLFYNMALGKFLDVQAAFGASGLHAKLVDASLDLLHGPSATAALVRAMHTVLVWHAGVDTSVTPCVARC